MKAKWDINGKGAAPKQAGEGGFTRYEGPNLPKGSWPAKVKRMEVKKIQAQGPNHGKPRISILLEVQTNHLKDEAKHKYHGAPVWDGLNIIEGSEGFVNGFLHALTDGSPAAKKAVESAFWDDDKGPDKKVITIQGGPREGQKETHLTKIGKYVISSPNGEHMIQITTRAGKNLDGDYAPQVASFISYKGPQPSADDEDSDVDVEDDDIEEDEDEDGDIDEDDDGLMSDDEDEDAEEDEDEDEDDEDAEEDEDEPEEAPAPVKRTRAKAKQPF